VKTEKPDIEAVYSGKQIQILEVAERLFAEHGFEGTSVRDIAHEAGVNVAMISYYFGSKEKLLEAVFSHRVSAGRLVLEHILADTEMHPLSKIDALVDGMVDRMMQHKNFHRVMQHAQLTTGNEEVAHFINQTKMKNLELVNKIIAEGQRKKAFVKGVDAAMLMMTVAGTVYQAAAGSAYFKAAHPELTATEDAHAELIKNKLKAHLKRVLKATLTYEGK
jgi:AcrR family transcriptional regulator